MTRTTLLVASLLLMTASIATAATRVDMVTSKGTIVLELDEETAPETVQNFVQYARAGFYDGTIFHRVIDDFMIQGGGFTEGLERKPTRDAIPNEAKNGLKNSRGTIAMARTGDPNSATSQFFINDADNTFLDYPGQDGWGYAVFGKVVDGMDVVDAISEVPTGPAGPFPKDVPQTPIVIEKVTVESDPASGN